VDGEIEYVGHNRTENPQSSVVVPVLQLSRVTAESVGAAPEKMQFLTNQQLSP
jgi:hypothetical protein